MKRILTLALALLMLATLFAGCSGDGNKTTTAATTAAATTAAATTAAATTAAATTAAATTAAPDASTSNWDTGSIKVDPLGIDLNGVTLKYMCDIGLNDARNQVWEKISQYASETYNGDVSFTLCDSSEYRAKIQTMSASGMAPDVFSTAATSGFPDFVKSDALLALDEYIPTCMPNAYAKVEPYMFDAVTFDGKIYAMIPFKDLVERNCIIYYKTPFDTAGVELKPFVRFSENYENFYAMREWRDANEPDKHDMPISEAYPTWYREAVLEYVGSSSSGIGCNFKDVNTVAGHAACTELFNMYDCPEFVAHCKTLNQLVTDRINPYDKSNWDKDQVLRNSGEVYCYNSQGTLFPNTTVLKYDNAALCVQAINLSYTGYTCGALQVASSGTEHPEEACKLIEILSCDKYIGTSLRHGLEGEHWSILDDGRIEMSDVAKETKIQYWYGVQLGDITNSLIPSNYAANFKDLLVELNSTAIISDNLGFTADSSNVEAEVAALKSVTSEYLSGTTLYSGMLTDEETDAMAAEFVEKMKGAGVDKVIAEYQAQLDAWRAAK